MPRSNIATPTNNVHLASPPIGESRAGTISDTVRYNQEVDNTSNSPPVFRPPPPRGTPPVVVEVKNLEVLSVKISSLLTPMRKGLGEGGENPFSELKLEIELERCDESLSKKVNILFGG